MSRKRIKSERLPGEGPETYPSVFNRSIVSMLVMVVFVGLGEKMAERFIPLYLGALGAGPAIMGALNGFDNILSALYSYPGGWISDRFGHRRALMFFTLAAAFGFLIVVLVKTWWAVFAGSLFFISWTAVSLPAIMSLINESVPKSRRVFGVSMHSLVRRFPMALGPIIGGALIGGVGIVQGVRVAFFAAFLLAIISIALMFFLVPDDKGAVTAPISLRGSFKSFSRELKILLAADVLIRFCEQLPYAFLAVWVCGNLGRSEFFFGGLTALEMLVAVLVYLPVAWLADRGNKKTYVVITFVFFTVFPLFLYAAGRISVLAGGEVFIVPMLVLAFVIRGFKEFGEPTRKSLILDLAPEDGKAATFGAYYLVRDVIVGVGSLSAGYLWRESPGLNFGVSFLFGLAGTLLFLIYGKSGKPENVAI